MSYPRQQRISLEEAKQLARRRERLGWDLTQLARRAGLSRPVVADSECGAYPYTVVVYPKILAALEAGERELVERARQIEAEAQSRAASSPTARARVAAGKG